MYVPATSAQPAALAVPPIPIEITAGGSSPSASGPTGLVTLGAGPEHISLTVRRLDLNVLADHTSMIAGTLKPGLSDKVVALQALGARGWGTIASTHTGRNGRFLVRYVPRHTGSKRVRLRFAGDSTDLPARRPLGRLNVHRLTEAASSSTRSFVRCVTTLESSMDWHIVDPPYSGGDQWTESTWQAAGGGRFAATAAGATPKQQMWVFERYEPSHPGAWPVTVPACS
jgi:hypothetical protein